MLKKILLIILSIIIFLPLSIVIYLWSANKFGLLKDVKVKEQYIELPNGYRYYCTSEHNCKVSLERYSSEEAYLPEKIFELAYNDRYVAAKQYGMKLKYSNNLNNTYKIPNSEKIYYWILDTQEKVRYGPYDNIQEFESKENDLKIGILKLKSVNSYIKTKK